MAHHLSQPGDTPDAVPVAVEPCAHCGGPCRLLTGGHSQDAPIDLAGPRLAELVVLGTKAMVTSGRDQPDDAAAAEDQEPEQPGMEELRRTVARDAEYNERKRARGLPWRVAGALEVAGLLVDGGVDLIAPDAGLGVVVGTCAVGAATLPALWLRFRQSIVERWRPRWWLAGALGCGWLGAAAAPMPMPDDMAPMTGVLYLLTLYVAAPWWREWEVPHPNDVVDEPAPPLALEAAPARREIEAAPAPREIRQIEPPTLAVRLEQEWIAAAAANDGRGAVPRGAELCDPVELPGGAVRFTVRLNPRAGVGATAFCGRRTDLALIWRLPSTAVHLQPGESEDLAYLTVTPQQRAALSAGMPYPGPSYRDGLVLIGVDDLGRERFYVAYRRGQAVSGGLVVGDPRVGKGGLWELVALGLRASVTAPSDVGVWRIWYGDGDPKGTSSNLLLDSGVAHWSGNTPEKLLLQLCAFEALIESRASQKNILTQDPETGFPVPRLSQDQPPINEFPPCPDFPAYLWIIPELFKAVTNDLLARARFGPRLEDVLRHCEKFGLAVGADTHTTAGKDFANSASLRAWLQKVNAWHMRVTDSHAQYGLTGLEGDPTTLPEEAGWAFSAGVDRDPVPLRTLWQEDLHKWVATLPPAADDDPAAALAIAPYLHTAVDGEPEDALEMHRARFAQWEENARAQAANLDAGPAALTQATVDEESVPDPLGDPVLRQNVIQLPTRHAPAAPADTPAAAVTPDLSPLSDRDRLVLDVLRAERCRMRSAKLIQRTGLAGPAVSEACKELARPERGLAARAHGWAEALPVADGPFRWSPRATTDVDDTNIDATHDTAAPDIETPATAPPATAGQRDWTALQACPSCKAEPRQDHRAECASARCPDCGATSCTDHEGSGRAARWHGMDPTTEIAIAAGWWIARSGAGDAPDVLRVVEAVQTGEVVWVPETQRYTRPSESDTTASAG
jgi:hypothetical protein